MTTDWNTVGTKRLNDIQPHFKIEEPCWFFNNGGCRNRDGSLKNSSECKYLHVYAPNAKRPPHLYIKKPCDKFNINGDCRWQDNCKYSHRNLTHEEWEHFYPNIQYKSVVTPPQIPQIYTPPPAPVIVHNPPQVSIGERINIIEFRQDGIGRDVQKIGQTLQEVVRQMAKIMAYVDSVKI